MSKPKILPLSGDKASGKVSYATRARADLQYLALSSKYMKCDDCKARLGFWNMFWRAVFKKKGAPYTVECKICGCKNTRKKGGLAEEFNKRWEDVEA